VKKEERHPDSRPIVRRKPDSSTTKKSFLHRRLRAAYVFDVSQTDGRTAADRRVQETRANTAIGFAHCCATNIRSVTPPHRTCTRHLVWRTDRTASGQSPAEEFSTLVHELAHASAPGDRREQRRANPRTEAEAAASCLPRYRLEAGSGIDSSSSGSDKER